ncbi:MAG: glutamine--fructose-6-phosphate transaminase (isomerizing) [Lachnospiraceae bacterium]|jgi:glucosamine--fructose-6-phosphate aminotransferase (isomerizing)|nr:glutamine--fructose-6-phosphate transaminase (isomerizing) [Lachnospiraceae bacterium]
MCGIVGYIGEKQAAPILLDGLARLEYRGYDSAGVAVYHDGKIEMVKASGRLSVVADMTDNGKSLKGTVGIGHTRWATHGSPTDVNAHPHFNEKESIVVVHNGIIENFQRLKSILMGYGYAFLSDTDTEVIAHLLDFYYKGNPLDAISKAMQRMEGSYALGIIFKEFPDNLFAVRKDSPLIVGKTSDGSILASDVPAILNYTRDVYYIENEEIVRMSASSMEFFNIDEKELIKEPVHINWDADAAEKGGYEFFMLKEINEQPKAVSDTFSPRIKNDIVDIEDLNLSDEEIRNINKLHVVACGSAWHTGMTAKYIYEGLAGIPVEVDLASEFRYRDPILPEGTLLIIISQSGETADSLAALRLAKKKGIKVLAIVNVVGSSIAREADIVFYTMAGPEIAVATTKAYSCQLIAHYLLAMKFAHVRGKISDVELKEMISAMRELPGKINTLIGEKERIQRFANRYLAAKDVFFMGRGIDYAISLEGSLKLKEISYIHSDAYAAGELKHGTISLIEDGSLVIAILTQKDLYAKTVSNIVEVKSRKAFVMVVTNESNKEAESVADYMVYIPETNKYFANSLAIIPLQLLAYYISLGKGLDVDKPRNLAKSVTVE